MEENPTQSVNQQQATAQPQDQQQSASEAKPEVTPTLESAETASESAGSQAVQPQVPTPPASESAEVQAQASTPPSHEPEAPKDATSEPVSISTSPQTEPQISTPPAQGVPPETEPENVESQTIQADIEPQSKPEPKVTQPQNPPAPTPPSILSLHYPFYGSYPVSFDFGAQPTDEKIKQKYQQWGVVGHNGIDFKVEEGTQVLACDEGTVVQAGDNGDFGISITIKHSWGTSVYSHLQSLGVLVNDHVSKAQLIGSFGQTGFTTGPHLHFGIQPNNPNTNNGYLGFINPTPYLSESSPLPQSPLPAEAPTKEGQPPQPLEPAKESEPDASTPPPISVADPAEVERLAQEKMKATWQQYQQKGNPAKQANKEESLKKIFAFAQEKKEITNEQVRDLLHVSQSTATDYLSQLVRSGMLKIEGKGKATVYLF